VAVALSGLLSLKPELVRNTGYAHAKTAVKKSAAAVNASFFMRILLL
jgi:hypothetical protein